MMKKDAMDCVKSVRSARGMETCSTPHLQSAVGDGPLRTVSQGIRSGEIFDCRRILLHRMNRSGGVGQNNGVECHQILQEEHPVHIRCSPIRSNR